MPNPNTFGCKGGCGNTGTEVAETGRYLGVFVVLMVALSAGITCWALIAGVLR